MVNIVVKGLIYIILKKPYLKNNGEFEKHNVYKKNDQKKRLIIDNYNNYIISYCDSLKDIQSVINISQNLETMIIVKSSFYCS